MINGEIVNIDFEHPHCQPGALTDSFGLFVQVILGILAFGSLVVKRALEPPLVRRPWNIWFFDTSKQAAGAGVIHLLNVFLAGVFRGDPCTWYVVSFLLDSTLGLLLIYIGVKIVSFLAERNHWETLKFGEYGKPAACKPWFRQCLVFVGITVLEKITVTLIIQFKFWRRIRKMILKPIQSPKLEVILVMLVIPFLVNTFMFWVVDNFIKKKLVKGTVAPSDAAVGDATFLPEGAVGIRREKVQKKGGSGSTFFNEEEIESLERLLDEGGEESEFVFAPSPRSKASVTTENEILTQRHYK